MRRSKITTLLRVPAVRKLTVMLIGALLLTVGVTVDPQLADAIVTAATAAAEVL